VQNHPKWQFGRKKIFAKGLEFLHVVFHVIEKCGPVFLLLVFVLFLSQVMVYVRTRKAKRKID